MRAQQPLRILSQRLARPIGTAAVRRDQTVAAADPRVVAVNLVQPEDGYNSMHDYHLHMKMVDYAKGVYPAKPLIPILGGLLTFESEWSPALGPSFEKALTADVDDGRLDIGCVAAHGHFFFNQSSTRFTFVNENKPATAFLFKLISELQFSGTVPMIDVEAYGQWLTK